MTSVHVGSLRPACRLYPEARQAARAGRVTLKTSPCGRRPWEVLVTEAVPQRRTNVTALLDWRRQVAALYAAVRSLADADVEAAHQLWQDEREQAAGNPPAVACPGRSAGQGSLACRSRRTIPRFGSRSRRHRSGAGQDRDADRNRRRGVVRAGRDRPACQASVTSTCGGWPATVAASSCRSRTPGPTARPIQAAATCSTRSRAQTSGGSDGSLVLDLNFAYNPSCAYDPAWACPLAPPGNTVQVPVNAGELMPD